MFQRALTSIVVLSLVVAASAAPALKPRPNKAIPLAGTIWTGVTFEGWAMTIEFKADGGMTVSYRGSSFSTASWKQDGDKIYWEMNKRYCEFNGKLTGDKIEGDSQNMAGKKWATKLTRIKDGTIEYVKFKWSIRQMNAEAIRKFLGKQPFEPIEVQLSSGQVYVIKHPECAMVLKNTLVIGNVEEDYVIWASLIHVASLRRKGDMLPAYRFAAMQNKCFNPRMKISPFENAGDA